MTRKLTFDEINRPYAVYRLFDEAGTLLYIGCSARPTRRREKHRKKSWWPEVAPERTTLEWFANWSLATLAEYYAIAQDEPKYNCQHALVYGREGAYQNKN